MMAYILSALNSDLGVIGETVGELGVPLLPWVSFANFLHAQQNDKESAAHDEFPPVEVGCPFLAEEVA